MPPLNGSSLGRRPLPGTRMRVRCRALPDARCFEWSQVRSTHLAEACRARFDARELTSALCKGVPGLSPAETDDEQRHTLAHRAGHDRRAGADGGPWGVLFALCLQAAAASHQGAALFLAKKSAACPGMARLRCAGGDALRCRCGSSRSTSPELGRFLTYAPASAAKRIRHPSQVRFGYLIRRCVALGSR